MSAKLKYSLAGFCNFHRPYSIREKRQKKALPLLQPSRSVPILPWDNWVQYKKVRFERALDRWC
jgi:hypothetical protein